MGSESIGREIASLPPEARRQALDFISFLKSRYGAAPPARKARQTQLAKEPFVGMWRTRKDMRDSAAWVRQLRRSEWERLS